jgi:hypothetical protein
MKGSLTNLHLTAAAAAAEGPIEDLERRAMMIKVNGTWATGDFLVDVLLHSRCHYLYVQCSLTQYLGSFVRQCRSAVGCSFCLF